MSPVLTTVITFVVVLSILVFVHELGHFSLAKSFGVRVFEFAIGFPPRLASFTRGTTTYAVNAIPLGGYVRMMGENGSDAENPESFGYKPWWQRAIILLAGPAMNIALAIILFFITMAWLGLPVGSNTIASIATCSTPSLRAGHCKESPAQLAGLRSGDRILRIDGQPTQTLTKIQQVISAHVGQRIPIAVSRNGRIVVVHAVPRPKSQRPANQGAVGVVMGAVSKTYPVGTALGRSFSQIGQTFMVIPNLVNNLTHQNTSGVSGPIGIARYTGQAAMRTRQYGIGELLGFVALISASLGVFNLLPIPALDGGRLVFVLLSGVRRRSLDPQVEGLIHLVGMAILLVLVALVSYQDIANWAGGQ